MPAPERLTTHIPGTSIALGLESGRRSWWLVLRAFRFVAVGMLFLAGIVVATVSFRQLGIGLAGIAVIAVMPACIVVVYLGWNFIERRVRPPLRVPRWPSPSARVGVVGTETQLRKLLALPPPKDEAFEPIALKIGPAWYVRLLIALATFALAVLVTVVVAALRRGNPAGWYLPLVIFTAAHGTTWAVYNLFPRYARLVPGRMDILQGSFLGRRLRLKQSYDLRTPAVLVDLNDRCLLLIHPGGRTQVMHLPDERSRAALVPEILRAAICSAPAAPLPDDALVG